MEFVSIDDKEGFCKVLWKVGEHGGCLLLLLLMLVRSKETFCHFWLCWGVRGSFKGSRSLSVVLNRVSRAKVNDVVFCGVCCIPGTTALDAEIPCFAVVLVSGCWVVGRIFDPVRKVRIVLPFVSIAGWLCH